MKKIASLERDIDAWQSVENEIDALTSLLDLDDGSLTEEISTQLEVLEKDLARKEIDLLLSG